MNDDIDAIAQLIENEVFHIKIRFGQYNRKDDLKILNELRSTNNKSRATAILKVAYHVRCNIFHGNKDFREYQRMLVEPLIRLLSCMNPFLYERLNK